MIQSGYASFNASSKGRPCSNSPREAQCIQMVFLLTLLKFFSSKGKMFFLPFIHSRALGFQPEAILIPSV